MENCVPMLYYAIVYFVVNVKNKLISYKQRIFLISGGRAFHIVLHGLYRTNSRKTNEQK